MNVWTTSRIAEIFLSGLNWWSDRSTKHPLPSSATMWMDMWNVRGNRNLTVAVFVFVSSGSSIWHPPCRQAAKQEEKSKVGGKPCRATTVFKCLRVFVTSPPKDHFIKYCSLAMIWDLRCCWFLNCTTLNREIRLVKSEGSFCLWPIW